MRKIIPTYFHEEQLWKELSRFIQDNSIRVNMNLQDFAIYHDLDYRDSEVDVEVCVPIEQMEFIDADEGTPILDLKPYTPSLDRVESPRVPVWCEHWPRAWRNQPILIERMYLIFK